MRFIHRNKTQWPSKVKSRTVAGPMQNILAEDHISIVFVHGLFGGPWKTWAAKARSPKHGFGRLENSSVAPVDALAKCKEQSSRHIFWPNTLLPLAVGNVKVYSFGYDADVEKFMASAGLNTVCLPGNV